MHTGKEMYRYVKDNKLGYAMSKCFATKGFDVVAKNLNADEVVIVPFMGLHDHKIKTILRR